MKDDAPLTVGNKTYNNYTHKFGGFTSIRKAITKSINIVTVKTLQDIGVDLGYEYAENFGFSTLTDTDRNLGISLGGLTQGVTNLELTAAYAAIANQGEYNTDKGTASGNKRGYRMASDGCHERCYDEWNGYAGLFRNRNGTGRKIRYDNAEQGCTVCRIYALLHLRGMGRI